MAKFKLTKKVAEAAYDEMVKVVGPINVEVDKKLPDEKFYKEFQQQVIDLEVDADDKANMSKETLAVLDALAAKFPDLKETADEEPAEEKEEKSEKKNKSDKKGKGKDKKEKEVEEKPAPEKKGKEKKGKKEEAAPATEKEKKAKGKKEEAVPEKPAKEEKKADKKGKGKKGSGLTSMSEVELREHMKKMKKDEIYQMIDAEPVLAAKAKELKAITNFMSLKKNIGLVLNGGEIEVNEPKPREKKEKGGKKDKKSKAEPTLTEQVEAIDDLDELKDFAKENKDSFPGVKAKKFDKLKKLRKALLEVVVEKAPAKTEKKAKKNNDAAREKTTAVVDFLTSKIDKAGGKIARLKLKQAGFEKFPDDEKRVRDQISYGTNEKYNKFKELLVEVDGVIGWKSVMKNVKPAKAEKKGKEEKAPAKTEKKGKEKAAPAKEEKAGKKEKKSKKDKKKDKKKNKK